MNYFELFELPISLKIDKSKLAQKYFELQKKNHPDFFAKGTEHEQEQALEISSQLNKALKIFKNPDQTITALVDEKSKTLGDKIEIRRFARFQVGEEIAG